VCCSCIVWVIFKWFQLPLLLPVSLLPSHSTCAKCLLWGFCILKSSHLLSWSSWSPYLLSFSVPFVSVFESSGMTILIGRQVFSFLTCSTILGHGLSSSIGIVTGYGLDGPRSNPGEDDIFCPSGPALGPTQPPIKWVPGLPRGKEWPGRDSDPSPPSTAVVKKE